MHHFAFIDDTPPQLYVSRALDDETVKTPMAERPLDSLVVVTVSGVYPAQQRPVLEDCAFFDTADKEALTLIEAAMPLPSATSEIIPYLVRMRIAWEFASGRRSMDWLADTPMIAKVAEIFHHAVEARAGASFTEKELCEHFMSISVTPFKSCRDAAEFMCLPVSGDKFVGIALKKCFVPAKTAASHMPEAPLCLNTTLGCRRNANMQLRSEPRCPRARHLLWNESTIEHDPYERHFDIEKESI